MLTAQMSLASGHHPRPPATDCPLVLPSDLRFGIAVSILNNGPLGHIPDLAVVIGSILRILFDQEPLFC